MQNGRKTYNFTMSYLKCVASSANLPFPDCSWKLQHWLPSEKQARNRKVRTSSTYPDGSHFSHGWPEKRRQPSKHHSWWVIKSLLSQTSLNYNCIIDQQALCKKILDMATKIACSIRAKFLQRAHLEKADCKHIFSCFYWVDATHWRETT